MTIAIVTTPIGKKLHRLDIYIDGQYIGQYERSQEADIERKQAEIVAAESLLRSLFQHHGEIVVRWNNERGVKSVRRIDGMEVGVIPKYAWQKPSWA